MSSSVLGASAGGGGGGGGGGSSSDGASGGSGGAGGGAAGGGGPCGACKFLRRKCVNGCIFAPYFDSEHGATHFAAVHKVFGASNVSKLLLQIPAHKRVDAVVTVSYEAQARVHDPVYGCVSQILSLQQQVTSLQAELTYLQGRLNTMELRAPPPLAAQTIQMPMTATFHIPNPSLPSSSTIPATTDLRTFFEPPTQPQWPLQQQQGQQEQYVTVGEGSVSGTMGGGDLQLLASDLLNRHGGGTAALASQPELPPCTQ